MPWDGLEETQRLVCDPLLDGEVLNVGAFMGQSLWIDASPKPPSLALGTSDFTIEWVVRFRDGDPSIGAADIPHLGGLTSDLNPTRANLELGWRMLPNGSFASQMVRVSYGVTGGAAGGTTFIAWPAPQTAFIHVAGTYDRSALLEGWVNGVKDLLDPTDISADVGFSIPSLAVHPFIAETAIRADFDALSDDPTTVALNKLFMTGFAVHNRLLTPAEISANAGALTVGNYGSGTTLVRYGMDGLLDAAGDPVDPSKKFTTVADMGIGQKWTVPTPWSTELFSVVDTDGNVFLEDSSGNARHYGLFTAASYDSSALANRCITAFAETGAM